MSKIPDCRSKRAKSPILDLKKIAKQAKFETGLKMAKSLVPDLCKNGKTRKIPDWFKYDKIAHTGPMEKWQNEKT